MMEPMDVMSAGRLAFAMDPGGAPYGIWQAGDDKGVEVYNEPGALVWNELVTRAYEGAKAFYSDVFGFTFDEIGEGFAYSTVKRASDGGVVAGLGELDVSGPAEVPARWVISFVVQDCDASATKAAELGATIVREPCDTPFGRMTCLTGAQGEAFLTDRGTEAGRQRREEFASLTHMQAHRALEHGLPTTAWPRTF
jgi:predicted enzyme related to lactoylglutathione lyase